MAKDRSPVRKAIDALQPLSYAKMTPERYESYINEIGSLSSDRGIGILMVTTVEDALQDAIESRLQITAEQSEAFFGKDSPMGTFAYKIRMGQALEVFGENIKRNLMMLKAIRNAFAHSKISIDFKTKEIIEVCNLLELPLPPTSPDGMQQTWSSQIESLKGRPRFQTVCLGHSSAFSTYAFLAKNNRHQSSDQSDKRYEELVRPKPLQ